MRRLSPRQSAAFMQSFRGGLSGLDPNSFPETPPDAPEDYVYNPVPGSGVNTAATMGIGANGAPLSLFSNHNNFAPYAFTDAFFINQNYRRTALMIQNLSGTDILAFNFGSAANATNGIQLNPGEGFLFDVITPNNSVYVQFLTGSGQSGFVLEGVYGPVPV